MRQIYKKLFTTFSIKTAIMIASTIVAVVVPVVVVAWGPTDRQLFTQANASDHVTFNSITDNPVWGDERNFMRIRDLDANATFSDVATLQPGRKYEIIVLYHNNAKSTLNADGTGIAKNAYARTEIPALVRSGASNVAAMAYVGASNAKPATVYDNVNLTNNTNVDIALRYVRGTAKVSSNGVVNGQSIPDSLFTSTGARLGYDSLNGTLPGCDQYSGYITFTVVADAPSFTFAKDVRLAGTKTWSDTVSAKPGDKVEYRLSYKNTGTTEQTDVVLKDILPKELKYIPGQTELVNSLAPAGKRMGDGIYGGGVNIGNYKPGANAYLYFFATVESVACQTLINKASVDTDNGTRDDIATVIVAGSCALPTTGPAEVISTFVGIAAITFGAVYYIKSRRELEDTLWNAQTHPHISSAAEDKMQTKEK